MKRTQGFALIELLVVIAIISVIAAILFPVFSRVREKARQSTCLSNLKQLGEAMQMYEDDHDGGFPPIRAYIATGQPQCNWAGVYGIGEKCDPTRGLLYPYVRNVSIFSCQSSRGADMPRIHPDALPYPLSYSMNNMLYGINERSVHSPSRVGLLIHEDPSSIDDCDFNWGGWAGHTDDVNVGHNNPASIHNGGTCIVYCDLHAKWESYDVAIQELENDAWNPDKP